MILVKSCDTMFTDKMNNCSNELCSACYCEYFGRKHE